VEFAVVDACQGRNVDICLVSTVRHNADGSIGFMTSSRRVLIMLSRAKHYLIV
ncbi:hypothetical protein PHYSODRAFT_434631, partial [Phytophthora sojae]